MKKIFFRDMKWLDRPIAGARKVLDVGAGGMKRAPHVTTMDILELPGTDVVHNADTYPWPFEDNAFDYVILSNVFEHMEDLVAFMSEVHRITRPGGIIRGVTPHFSNPCTYADPTHEHAVSVHIFDFFCRIRSGSPILKLGRQVLGCDMGVGAQVVMPLFEPRRISLRFREILWPTLAPVWANLFQNFFEVYGHRLLPAWDVLFELEVLPLET
jgi:SAM-dependent methyltransferase